MALLQVLTLSVFGSYGLRCAARSDSGSLWGGAYGRGARPVPAGPRLDAGQVSATSPHPSLWLDTDRKQAFSVAKYSSTTSGTIRSAPCRRRLTEATGPARFWHMPFLQCAHETRVRDCPLAPLVP